MIAKHLFAGYVRNGLTNLYDPIHLQTNPLIELLRLHDGDGSPAAALRELLREAIESLRPVDGIPGGRPEWLGYRLMLLRYVRSYSPQATCDELAFSIATFYRRHRKGLDAVVGNLWQRYQKISASLSQVLNGARSGTQRARDEAIKLARKARRQPVHLDALLDETRRMIEPLAKQRGLTLETRAPAELPTLYGDPACLRQILLNVLIEGIDLAASPTLTLEVSPDRDEIRFILGRLDDRMVAGKPFEEIAGFIVSRALLDVYEGRLWFAGDAETSTTLFFTIPLAKPKQIIIIDDDAELVRLYQLQLRAHGYAVRGAEDSQQLREHLDTALPDLFLLDVLMPQEDGWHILRYLKSRPDTISIPVVVCSVLTQPELAFTMGAKEVLQKPVQEETLVRTVRAILASPSS